MLFGYKQIISLNENESGVFRYVIEHPTAAVSMNIRELAQETNTSTATVARMYKKLGCASYPVFLSRIQAYEQQMPDMNTCAGYTVSALQETVDKIQKDNDPWQKAVRMILESDAVTVMGCGNCGALAEYAARYLSNAGFYATAVTDVFYPPRLGNTQKHLILMLSESGENRELVKQAKLNQKYGSHLVVMSSNPDSTLASLAEVALPITMPRFLLPQTYDLTSGISMLYGIEYLGQELLRQNDRIKKIDPKIDLDAGKA
ncbi:MAG: MurR/RpiR family transcriptional regulator [Lactimicrobium sp.]|jgi:DNA-binding MurR/RpiR family transcriptional regulator|uniref:MurR/RpiR family transcriptional regulator n=1 Tax=Lactimicrobium sp. TaxID=2563780 RepID=UPI002F357475